MQSLIKEFSFISELVQISVLNGYLECAAELKCNVQPLLKACGIDKKRLIRQEGYISFSQFAKLLELTAERSNTPEFGLLFSQKRTVTTLGVLGLLIEKKPDLRSAIQEYIRFSHIHTKGTTLHLQEDASLAVLSVQLLIPLPANRQVIDLLTATLALVTKLLTERKLPIRHIYLSHADHGNAIKYERLLGAPVTFDHELNGIAFDRSYLDTPLHRRNEQSYQLLVQQIQATNSTQGKDISDTVRTLIVSLLPYGGGNVDEVAQQLLISRRKLQYQLSDAGTSFKDLLEQIRKTQAKQYLQESNMSLAQMSELLGYLDQTAFTRAFKIWFGITPAAWKKKATQ